MQMLYNSDHYAVVVFEVPAEGDEGVHGAAAATPAATAPGEPAAAPVTTLPVAAEPGRPRLSRGGFEIVDKFARKEIFIEGALAEHFHRGVQALVEQGPNEEALDDFIGGFTTLAQQPLVLH